MNYSKQDAQVLLITQGVTVAGDPFIPTAVRYVILSEDSNNTCRRRHPRTLTVWETLILHHTAAGVL